MINNTLFNHINNTIQKLIVSKMSASTDVPLKRRPSLSRQGFVSNGSRRQSNVYYNDPIEGRRWDEDEDELELEARDEKIYEIPQNVFNSNNDPQNRPQSFIRQPRRRSDDIYMNMSVAQRGEIVSQVVNFDNIKSSNTLKYNGNIWYKLYIFKIIMRNLSLLFEITYHIGLNDEISRFDIGNKNPFALRFCSDKFFGLALLVFLILWAAVGSYGTFCFIIKHY